MPISALVQVEVGACTVIYAFKNGIILGGNNEDWEDHEDIPTGRNPSDSERIQG